MALVDTILTKWGVREILASLLAGSFPDGTAASGKVQMIAGSAQIGKVEPVTAGGHAVTDDVKDAVEVSAQAGALDDGHSVTLGSTTDAPASTVVPQTAAASTSVSLLKGTLNILIAAAATFTGIVAVLNAIAATLTAFSAKFSVLGQETMANSAPVVLASDQTAIPVTAAQPLRANLNLNATAQVAGVDVGAGANAMPVQDGGNAITVDGAVTLGAAENHIGQVSIGGAEPAQTPAITAGAYSAKDAVGGLLTFANAARVQGGIGVIEKLVITDLSIQAAELILVLFDRTFTAMADNAPFDPSDADLANCLGWIDIGTGLYQTFTDH